MSRSLNRLWLLPVVLLASQSWALGLGDIRLSSALNEPLRAEIALLAATPEELENLTVQLSDQETFARYDLDRPLFLSGLQFRFVRSGTADGNFVRITSVEPITEPFITFLVEAVWTRGRLLREYTVLLDPPTFAPPPATQSTQAVTAPTRAAQTDSGQIQRPPPQAPVPAPVPAPAPAQEPAMQSDQMTEPAAAGPAEEPSPALGEPSFDTVAPGDVLVRRGDTLWGITSRVRSDSRLTMNQMMLAIYEANPRAFSGNINMLSAGATLRIPSADEVFRISRGDALAEVQRQNAAWGGGTTAVAAQSQPALTLVPPDEDVDLFEEDAGQPVAEEQPVEDLIDADEARIAEIEAVLQDHQDSLIEITDNELAALRTELAELRGEEPPEPLPAEEAVEEPFVDEVDDTLADAALLEAEPAATDEDIEAPAVEDEIMAEDLADETTPEVADTAPVPRVMEVTQTPRKQSLVEQILGYVNSIWGIIGGALLAAIAVLIWFARRAGGGGDEDSTGVWESLEQDDVDSETLASTERLRALASQDDSAIVVVEQDSALARQREREQEDSMSEPHAATVVEDEPMFQPEPATFAEPEPEPEDDSLADTFEATAVEDEPPLEFTAPEAEPEPFAESTAEDVSDDAVDFEHDRSLDDTFQSETAINLDQADPAAEADFHMAYGLYDQAADLINGALEVDPENEDLLAKLCEIYFVWGNRDAFVDAAGRLRAVVSDEANPEWDKIVIMGQQIAADHEMFSGVSAGAATRAVDLAFDGGMDEAGELDMDFESGESGGGSMDLDLGAETGQYPVPDATAEIDFDMSEEDMDIGASMTSEMPSFDLDSPTVDASTDDDTAEAPLIDESSDAPTIEQQFASLDETGAMPSISELGDDDATEVTSFDDFEEGDEATPADATAEIDLDDLGLDLQGLEASRIAAPEDELEDQISDFDDTAESRTIDESLDATGEMPDVEDLTDKNLAISDDDDTATGLDTSLLDATGQTQILSEDSAVDTASDLGASLSDDDQTVLADPLEDDVDTMLAPLGDDESTVLTSDINFDDLGKTEALPKDAFTGNASMDDTGEMPSLAGSTDLDLDLDDLTAALKVSKVGDGEDRDDETAEMPITSGDTDDARTMTEVGTKLDLARAYVDMGDPSGARSILKEVLDEGDEGQRQQAQQILESIPS